MSDEEEQHDANVAPPPPCQKEHNHSIILLYRSFQIKFMPQPKQRGTIQQFSLNSWNGSKEEIHYQMIMCSQTKRRDQSALMTSINTSA